MPGELQGVFYLAQLRAQLGVFIAQLSVFACAAGRQAGFASAVHHKNVPWPAAYCVLVPAE